MWVWRERYAELGALEDVHYVMPFENRGAEVGATLSHPHGQIYAFPFLPPVPAAEREADRRRGSCVVCALAAEAGERPSRTRASARTCPGRRAGPTNSTCGPEHRESLVELTGGEMRDLAEALQTATRTLDALFARPLPYMLCLHSAPTDSEGRGHLHAELYTPARAPGVLQASGFLRAGRGHDAGRRAARAGSRRAAGALRSSGS